MRYLHQSMQKKSRPRCGAGLNLLGTKRIHERVEKRDVVPSLEILFILMSCLASFCTGIKVTLTVVLYYTEPCVFAILGARESSGSMDGRYCCLEGYAQQMDPNGKKTR